MRQRSSVHHRGSLIVQLTGIRSLISSDPHADIPRTPYDSTQIAYCNTVADTVDMSAFLAERRRNKSDTIDNGIALLLERVIGSLDDAVPVSDLGDGAVQIHGNFVILHRIAQEGCVGKAGCLSGNKVIAILDYDRVLAGKDKIVGSFTGGLTAAEEYDLITFNRLLAKELAEGTGLLKSLDARHVSGNGTGADDDLVIGLEEFIHILDLGVEADLNAVSLYFILIPLEELLVVLLEGHGRSCQEQTAQFVLFLEDNGIVPALFENERRFHTADAAADDGNLLRVLRGNDLITVVLHGGRVQSAACKMQGIAESLHVFGSGCLGEVETAVVATDAGADLVLTALFDLGDPVFINEVLTGNCNSIQTSGSNFFSSLDRIHTAGAGHRNIDELADVLNIGEVAVVRHILRRMCPVPGIIGSVVAVEEGVSGILEDLDGLLGLRHVTAELFKFFTGHCTFSPALCAGAHGVTERNREVVTGLLVDLLNDLSSKAETVLKGSAVLVGTEVHIRYSKLVKVVAFVYSMDLDTVDSCLTEFLCSGAERSC